MNFTAILAMMVSWKTSAAGLATVATAIAKFLYDFSLPVFNPETLYTDFGLITAAIGLLVAKDANVTNSSPATTVAAKATTK